jgi:hypothetical protein
MPNSPLPGTIGIASAVDFRQTTETSPAGGRVSPGLGATAAVLPATNAVIRPKRRPRLLVIIRGEIPHRSEVGMSERPNHVVSIRGLSGRPLFEAATANDSG